MKLLTGKCKEDFEKFLISFYYNQESETKLTAKIKVASFYNYPIEMQFGVIQDFADSVGVTMDAFGYSFEKGAYNGAINDKFVSLKDLESLEKAREEAIKQFNKIYNGASI